MANLDFYATIEDHEVFLADLFQAEDLRIFESYSALGCDLKEFSEPAQILDQLRHAQQPRHAVLLQAWVPAASSKVEVRRLSVSVGGHTHRYCISGWGLIQLYLSKETDIEISPSHFGHFNRRGAEKWSLSGLLAGSNPGMAADWDWDVKKYRAAFSTA